MKSLLIGFGLILFFLMNSETFADQVYTWTDKDGNMHITAEPPPKNARVKDVLRSAPRPEKSATDIEQQPDSDEVRQARAMAELARKEAETARAKAEEATKAAEDYIETHVQNQFTQRANQEQMRKAIQEAKTARELARIAEEKAIEAEEKAKLVEKRARELAD